MNAEKFFPRDLSWLSFNERILQEATRPDIPLYERIKFLAIYSSNLYEFYRVRVATLRRLVDLKSKKINRKIDEASEDLLKKVEQVIQIQLEQYGNTIRQDIIPALAQEDIHLYFDQPVPEELHPALLHYFRSQVLGYLRVVHSSQLTAGKHALEEHQMYLLFDFEPDGWAYVNIPQKISRYFVVPTDLSGHHIVWLDDIIRLFPKYMFPNKEVKSSYSIVLSRDADLLIEDEYEGNLVEKIRKQIKKRDWGKATRLLYDPAISSELLSQLKSAFGLSRRDLVSGGRYHNLNDLFSFPNPSQPALEYESWPPLNKASLKAKPSLLTHLEDQDELLMFPYHTYDYVLQFFNEAAVHPEVKEINITLYRIASQSKVAEALITAALNGKRVKVFVEVKARFDEENNIRWATRMEEAGVKIIYSMPDLKVHAKIALVKCRKGDKAQNYAYLGTGNFNEKTARIYSDLALLTTHSEIIKDLNRVFKFLYKRKELAEVKHLLVAPVTLKTSMLEYIDREIALAHEEKKAEITLKLNALEDKEMISKLYDASRAGVKITLVIRGICCLRPQIPNLSENITVIRIVDRFLEHARVFIFHNDGDEKMYLASADWMERNLHRRVEVAFPIYDEAIRNHIQKMLEFQLRDNQQAVVLDQNMNNLPAKNRKKKIRSQQEIYRWLAKHEGTI